MRGQLTLEYLLLATAALLMLSVSVLSFSALRGSAVAASGALRFEADATSLSNAMDEVCALGDGNGREVRLSVPLEMESAEAPYGWAVSFSYGGYSLARESLCEVAPGGLSGTVYVENEKGGIKIKGR
jgi:hypothetical protein